MIAEIRSIAHQLTEIAKQLESSSDGEDTKRSDFIRRDFSQLVLRLSDICAGPSESFGEKPKPGLEAKIVFREIRQHGPVTYWHVEAYSPEGNQFPVGTAYVKSIEENQFAQLDFILVADHWRRQGFGTRLTRAIRERWPNAVSTGPIDNAGKGLLQSIAWITEED